ncbi:MAG: LemA family protein [Candidatus Micrarchaeota archaeon]|nr:LemA family protein [Candidatus Micrarchaeota archaeon]
MGLEQKVGIGLIIGIVLVILVAVPLLFFMFTYNDLVAKEETVKKQWGNVESAYQRRFDLIPNLEATVKAYASHEREILNEFAKARQMQAQASTIEDKVKAANQLESTLAKLMVVVENYPQLKADANFREMMAELAGTENRINVERNRYNEAVSAYMATKRSFPASIIASMFNFKDYEYFKVQNEQAKTAPKVFQ